MYTAHQIITSQNNEKRNPVNVFELFKIRNSNIVTVLQGATVMELPFLTFPGSFLQSQWGSQQGRLQVVFTHNTPLPVYTLLGLPCPSLTHTQSVLGLQALSGHP